MESRSADKSLQIFLRSFMKAITDWFSRNQEFASASFELLSNDVRMLMSQTPHPSSEVVNRAVLTVSIFRNPHDKKEFTKVSFRPMPNESEVSTPKSPTELPQPLPPALAQRVTEFCRSLGAEAFKCFQQSNCRDCLQLISSLIEFDDYALTLNATVEDPFPVLLSLLGDLNGSNDSCVAYTFFKLLQSFDSLNR